MSATALAALLRPGDRILVGNGTAEPDALIAALIETTRGFDRPVEAIQVTTGSREALAAPHPGLRLLSPAPGRATRRAIEAGKAELLMATIGQLGRWIAEGGFRVDGVLFQAGPREGGLAWPGLSLDLVQPAFDRARFRAVEVNAALPRVPSPWRPDLARCELVLPVESPPRAGAEEEAGAAGPAIAAGIAELLPAGATLELGIGRVAAGLAAALAGRGGFALHTGLITDEVRRLVECGVVDRPPLPELAPALVVGSVLRGSAELYRWADRNPALRIEDARGTHDVARLAGLPRFVAVNGALQVDLLANANGLMVGGRLLGGLGGALDYATAGANAAGSVIALSAATRQGAPRIVPAVETVTIPALQVTHLVTEHGAARLAGLSPAGRARAIIPLAAPEHRDALREAARAQGWL